MVASGEYPAGHIRHLLAFCKTQSSRYVQQTASWLRKNYPANAEQIIPQLRPIYLERKEAEAKKLAAWFKSF